MGTTSRPSGGSMIRPKLESVLTGGITVVLVTTNLSFELWWVLHEWTNKPRLPGYVGGTVLASVVKNVFTCHVDVEGGHCSRLWRIWILIVCTGNSTCSKQSMLQCFLRSRVSHSTSTFHTVDGSEIQKKPGEVDSLSYYFQGFSNIQTVVGLGISEPSTETIPWSTSLIQCNFTSMSTHELEKVNV